MVEYYDEEKDLLLVFLSNNFEVSALKIARLYKNRWQTEVFFKRIKQNLVIKKLWGHSQNAVKIHVWTAICAYLIVAYMKHILKSNYSIYEIMQILSVSAYAARVEMNHQKISSGGLTMQYAMMHSFKYLFF